MSERLRYHVPFHQVPDEVLQDERTTVYHIALFSVLAMHAGKDNRAWPSYKRLADLCGCSRSKVKSTVAELQAMGWITVECRKDEETGLNHTNIYSLASSLQGRAHGDRGVGQEVTEGRAHGDPESYSGNHTNLNHTSRADARVAEPRQPPALRDELQRYIDEQMRAVQPYENFGRERGQIKTIAARCRRRDSENPQGVAEAMMTMFETLRQNGDSFWQKQPFTPSALSSLWERIEREGQLLTEVPDWAWDPREAREESAR